jgi:antitoxin component YwqK of YwqJK toxin-antitoxin module
MVLTNKISSNGTLLSRYNTINGLYYDLYESFYENGQQNELINYKISGNNTYKHGLYRKYDVSGVLLLRCNYYYDQLVDLYESFYENGTRNEIINYKILNNYVYKHGPCVKYTNCNVIQIRCNYYYNKLNGLYESFYTNGAKHEIINYSILGDNVYKHGLYERYESCKFIQLRCNYYYNKLNGLYESFYPNGSKNEVINYKLLSDNVYKHGPYEKYTGNNIIQLRCNYYYNKLNGLYESFHSTGSKHEVINYKLLSDNVYKHGPYEKYIGNNIIQLRCNYYYNKLNGLYESFHSTGSKHEVINYKLLSDNVYKHGPYEKYNNHNKLQIKCNYYYNQLTDLYESFHENGTRSYIVTYKIYGGNVLKHGLYEKYDSNGTLEIRCNYLYDKLSGVYEKFNSPIKNIILSVWLALKEVIVRILII